jgi:hypothetical protein
MNSNELPIACTLTEAELRERRKEVLSRLTIADVSELENGYVYRFPAGSISELAFLIDLERQCCPFLTFRLTVEPGATGISLEITGPAGSKEFLREVFN